MVLNRARQVHGLVENILVEIGTNIVLAFVFADNKTSILLTKQSRMQFKFHSNFYIFG